MEEKTLGQIAYEQYGSRWDIQLASMKEVWEGVAKAVAAVVRAESQWQPIETAPRDGTDVLIYVPYYPDGARIETGWFSSKGYWESYSRLYAGEHHSPLCRLQPTHWQPLPEPPK